MNHRSTMSLVSIALLAAAGCGAGSSGGASATLPGGPAGNAQMLALHFGGTGTLSNTRAAKDFNGVNVTVFFGGKAVATGTLNSAGALNIALPGVPPGGTIIVVAGSKKASFATSTTAPATVATITLNADGTITVSAAASGSATNPVPNGQDAETEVEDGDGNPIEISDDNSGVLPSNLPFSVSTNCTTVTLTPNAGSTFGRLLFEEKVEDNDVASKFRFDGAFTGSVTAPIIGASARIHIVVFDASGKQIVEVKAPVNAFTLPAGGASPSPCPSVAPTSLPSPAASGSPAPSASPEH